MKAIHTQNKGIPSSKVWIPAFAERNKIRNNGDGQMSATRSTETSEGPRVLVVDDNLMSRKVIAYRLTQDGYEVAMASDGAEALDLVHAGGINLIFLDLFMTGMGGMEVLASLKSDAQYADIPVVVISGVEEADAVTKCLDAGASEFLHKPVMASTLREIVSDLIGPPAGDTAALEAVEPASADLPLLDPAFVAQLEKDYGNETTKNFIDRFESLAPGQKQAIAEAAEAGELEEWRRAANGLKGGARTLGLNRLAATCRDIERACTNGQAADAQEATRVLDDILENSLASLQSYAQQL